jgi:hypothetical protein
MKRPDSTQREDSMQCEYDSLMKHETWTLVPRPVNVNIIASKWVFKTKVVKNDADLDITKYTSRLVAKGYSQIQGVDYEETFAPVVKFPSIRILLALVTHFNLELHQMDDVDTAFPNGDLDEIIHMEQPEGFVKPEDTDKVCRLRKALYGLKQANRPWYAKMDTFLCEELGFTRNAADHCFNVRIKGGRITLIALYVDDLLIACADKPILDTIKQALSMKFEMKEMGEAQKCLGLEIFRCRKDGILTVSQSEYAKMVLARYEMAEVYGANTPMECVLKLALKLT